MNLNSGAAQFLPVDQVTAALDSQMRFYAVWFMLPFFITIWIVRNLDVACPVMVITFGTMALAGAARFYFAMEYGFPQPEMLVAAITEIWVLIFLPWHRAVTRNAPPVLA